MPQEQELKVHGVIFIAILNNKTQIQSWTQVQSNFIKQRLNAERLCPRMCRRCVLVIAWQRLHAFCLSVTCSSCLFPDTWKPKRFHTSDLKLVEASPVSQTLSLGSTTCCVYHFTLRGEHKGRWVCMDWSELLCFTVAETKKNPKTVHSLPRRPILWNCPRRHFCHHDTAKNDNIPDKFV